MKKSLKQFPFNKYSKNRDDDLVKSLDEVYNVGTFTQIREIQDLGDKLRMVVMGVRRISINGAASDDLYSSGPAQNLNDSQIGIYSKF